MIDCQNEKKYFFFDIDGTLIPDTGGLIVPKETQDAITTLRVRGHFCAIATGRPQYFAVDICKQLGFDNYVSDGGNGVTLDGKLKCLLPMPHEDCVTLVKQCEAKGYPWAISTENRPSRYTQSKAFIDGIGTEYMNSYVIPDLDIINCPEIYKMFVVCKEGDETNLPILFKMNWERYAPDHIVVEPGNKEAGIRRVMDYLNAPYRDVVVFGNDTNDISMFQSEWTNIAMGNAILELKEKADYITLNSTDGGIPYALKHFGWI